MNGYKIITYMILGLAFIALLQNPNDVSNNILTVEMMGHSMEPSIKEGDVGYAIKLNETQMLKEGDIVIFYDERSPSLKTAHRIYKIENENYYLIGDNRKNTNHDIVTRDKILYKLIGISYS